MKILELGFFLKKKTRMVDKTIDIFNKKKLVPCKSRLILNHLTTEENEPRSFMRSINFQQWNFKHQSSHKATISTKNSQSTKRGETALIKLQYAHFFLGLKSSGIGVLKNELWKNLSRKKWQQTTLKFTPTSVICETFWHFYIKRTFDGKKDDDPWDVKTWDSYWLHNFVEGFS